MSMKGNMENQPNPTAQAAPQPDVQKMISDSVTAATKPLLEQLGKLQNGLTEHAKTADALGARRRYIEEKMPGIPAAYTQSMPETGDAGKLAQAEQAIRKQYGDDLKKAGVKIPNVSGEPPSNGGNLMSGPPPERQARASTGKKTPTELVAEGLRRLDIKP